MHHHVINFARNQTFIELYYIVGRILRSLITYMLACVLPLEKY
jgi:hypothetical protein